ncbi:tyrosinase [Stylonychia lemnae]|uniref:Tyrosinase n=1 Tax=Stylonychia lemnae TaxID=5949 RepID=A0A078AII6_STYLE|nr:tyrosinase [Stylonychia lemnae]|eukprot:CDW82065.1 tyrosinase [Stylonychia lemnae]
MVEAQLSLRRNILDIQTDYEQGNRKELSDLLRAWKGIKELPVEDPKSFYNIAGYHGLPFTGKIEPGNSKWWGGYCNHGNVLFPSWHRAYLHNIEKALQSIEGCQNVRLAFLDQTSEETKSRGLPWVFTVPKIVLDDGTEIDNPILHYKLQKELADTAIVDGYDYSKPKGYTTVRYPLSGLYGTENDIINTVKHNSQFDHNSQVTLLNLNVTNWLNSQQTAVAEKYNQCLQIPNYTLFSNTTSAGQFNRDHPDHPVIVPLENPHNWMHLCIGGFTSQDGNVRDPIAYTVGSNGDMGENETAAFDPIFFFHHCWIDLVFWKWQQLHDATTHFDVEKGYPGTNTSDTGVQVNADQNEDEELNIDSPLHPFINEATGALYTTRDVTNIENLGYQYGPNSLDLVQLPADDQKAESLKGTVVAKKRLEVKGINRAYIQGSFIVAQYEIIDGERQFIGAEPILSRWNVLSCSNCHYHLDVKAYFDVDTIEGVPSNKRIFQTQCVTRQGIQNLPSVFRTESYSYEDYSCEILN